MQSKVGYENTRPFLLPKLRRIKLKRKNTEEVLVHLIQTLQANLDEIMESVHDDEFVCGEAYAYLECLEIIQTWTGAEKYGICGNLEEKYLAE